MSHLGTAPRSFAASSGSTLWVHLGGARLPGLLGLSPFRAIVPSACAELSGGPVSHLGLSLSVLDTLT